MKALASFFLSRDGIVAVATLILLGVVSHFSDPYNPWINLLARVGNVCVFLYILWRAAGKAIVDGLSNRRAAIVDELDSLAVRKAAAEEQLAAMIEKIDSLDAECETILKTAGPVAKPSVRRLSPMPSKRRKRFATPRTALPTAKRRKPLRNCGARWPTKSCRLWKLP